MKKVFAILCTVLTIALMLTGCSGQKAENHYTIGIGQFGPHGSLDNCREGFLLGLAEEGIVEGENLTVKYQNANFDGSTTNTIAQAFVSDKVDLICAIATPMAQAAYNAAEGSDIPVVFTAITDVELAGLTEGNITGTSDMLPVEDQLKLIRAMMPDAKRIGILYTTSESNSISTIATYKELAPNYGFEIVDTGVATQADVPLAVDNLVTKVDCISNLTDNTVVGALPVILDAAGEKNIPVFGSEIEQVKLGCVAAEGLDYIDLGKQTGRMAAKVLTGEAKASEIPYEVLKESQLTINSDVMAELNLTLPEDMMSRATDVAQ